MSKEQTYFFDNVSRVYEIIKENPEQKEMVEKTTRDFLVKSFNSDIDGKVKRFLEKPSHGYLPTSHEYFKLYYELKQLYVNGFYYSTIVLAGILNERICYDILSRNLIELNKKKLGDKEIACLYEMYLVRLIDLLLNWGLINEKTRSQMCKINDMRVAYVHPKKTKKDMQKDAYDALKRVTQILIDEFEVKFGPAVKFEPAK